MTLTLMDYSGDKTDFEIGSLDDIESIDITVISGDETADVYYKNGTNTTFDSSNTRLYNLYDYSYTLYDNGKWRETEWLMEKGNRRWIMSLRERIENWLRDYEYAVKYTEWEVEPFMEDAAELLYEVKEKWEDEREE